MASQEGLADTVKLLIKHSSLATDRADFEGRTPLSHAAEEGHYEVMQLLLTQEIDVDSRNTDGRIISFYFPYKPSIPLGLYLVFVQTRTNLLSKQVLPRTKLIKSELESHGMVPHSSRYSLVFPHDPIP